jgi:hypothetical protein
MKAYRQSGFNENLTPRRDGRARKELCLARSLVGKPGVAEPVVIGCRHLT